ANSRNYDTWKNTGADLSVHYVQSPNTGWYTVLLVPLSAQSAFTSNIIWITVLISLMAITAGAILIYFNSRKLYAPIRQWLRDENYSSDDTRKDEWDWLRN